MEEYEINIRKIIKELGSAVIAFSGGTDSTLLARLAAEELGDKALAVCSASASLPQSELDGAKDVAKRIGVELELIQTRELENDEYVANNPDRCYHCKTLLYEYLRDIAIEKGLQHIIDGSNTDDSIDYRPGKKAAKKKGVRHPFVEAEMGKVEIRELSKKLDLPTWNKPASACLASRFPYGEKITEERLRRVEKVENALHDLGFSQVRARFHEPVVRIELPQNQFSMILDPEIRKLIVEIGKSAGFLYVSLDMQGYRTGSLNDALEKDE